MAAFAVTSPGMPCSLGESGTDGNNLGIDSVEKQIKFMATRLAISRFNNHGSLEDRGGGHQPHRIAGNSIEEFRSLRLPEQNGKDRGGIDHHQVGNPFSS